MDLKQWIEQVEAQPDPSWLIDKLLFAQSTALLTGPPTLGHKTWFAMLLSLIVGEGKKYACFNGGHKRVLFYEREKAPKPTAQRFRALEQGCGINIGAGVDFRHMSPLNLANVAQTQVIAGEIEQNQIGLVIIDTLAKCMKGDENSVEDMSRAMEGVDRMRAAGATVLLLHHTKKTSQDFDDAQDIDQEVRGSSALIGFADTHLALRPAGNKVLTLTARHNDAQEFRWQLRWDIESNESSIAKRATLMVEELGDSSSIVAGFVLDGFTNTIINSHRNEFSVRGLRKLLMLPSDDVAIDIGNQLVSDGILVFDSSGRKYRKPEIV